MIHEDCKNCEMLDLDNPEFPCKLECTGSLLRCNILKEYAEKTYFKRGKAYEL